MSAISLSIPELFHAIGWALIHSLWQVSLVVIFLSVLKNNRIIKSPAALYEAGIAGHMIILGSLLISFLLYLDPVTISGHPVQDITAGSVEGGQSVSWNGMLGLYEWMDQYAGKLTTIWILGFLLFCLRFTSGLIYLETLKRTAEKFDHADIYKRLEKMIRLTGRSARVRILISPKVLTPVTFGLFRAVIILPVAYVNGLEPRHTEMILAHELSHILRKDYLSNLLINLSKTLLYFHPGIWWMDRFINVEREKATDELAMRICTHKPSEYARTLLKVQEMKNEQMSKKRLLSSIALPLFRNSEELLYRVERILGMPERKGSGIHNLAALILVAGMALWTGFRDYGMPGYNAHPVFAFEEIVPGSSGSKAGTANTICDTLVLVIQSEEEFGTVSLEKKEPLPPVQMDTDLANQNESKSKGSDPVPMIRKEFTILIDSFQTEPFEGLFPHVSLERKLIVLDSGFRVNPGSLPYGDPAIHWPDLSRSLAQLKSIQRQLGEREIRKREEPQHWMDEMEYWTQNTLKWYQHQIQIHERSFPDLSDPTLWPAPHEKCIENFPDSIIRIRKIRLDDRSGDRVYILTDINACMDWQFREGFRFDHGDSLFIFRAS